MRPMARVRRKPSAYDFFSSTNVLVVPRSLAVNTIFIDLPSGETTMCDIPTILPSRLSVSSMVFGSSRYSKVTMVCPGSPMVR